MIDTTTQIDQVHRAVSTRQLDSGEARVATISQSYDTTIEDLWDACTNIQRIPRWLMPITGELRLGGRYQLEGNAGGIVETCDRPDHFSATWEFGGEVSWIDVTLTSTAAGRAELTVEHVAHVDAQRWAQYGPSAVGIGWDSMLLGLATYLSSGVAVDPAEAIGWMASDEGKQFMLASSRRWCDADVLSGADPAAAQAAAERTYQAYTGQPEG
jgi:uncharacterized protein YndB with AHSA1/START domain